MVPVSDPPKPAEPLAQALNEVEEGDGDPSTVVVPDMEALVAASVTRLPHSPTEEIRIESTLARGFASSLSHAPAPHEVLASLTVASAAAVILAMLVVVAILGVVGGLGISIALGNVMG